jgi:hypothetical protein
MTLELACSIWMLTQSGVVLFLKMHLRLVVLMALRVVSDSRRACPTMKAVTGIGDLARPVSRAIPISRSDSVPLYQPYRAGFGATKEARQTRMSAGS